MEMPEKSGTNRERYIHHEGHYTIVQGQLEIYAHVVFIL